MKAVIFALVVVGLSAQADTNVRTYLKNDNKKVSLELSKLDGSITFVNKGNTVLKSQTHQMSLFSGNFLIPNPNKACPPLTIELSSSLNHGTRGTLADVKLSLGDFSKSDIDEDCKELSSLESIVGEYTQKEFTK